MAKLLTVVSLCTCTCLLTCVPPADELERLEQAFDVVKKQLFGRLHAIARKSLLPEVSPEAAIPAPCSNGSGGSSRSSNSGSDDENSTKSSSSAISSTASLPSLTVVDAAAANGVAGGKMRNGAEKVASTAAAKTASENGVSAAPSKK
jgi:hypothetical protein